MWAIHRRRSVSCATSCGVGEDKGTATAEGDDGRADWQDDEGEGGEGEARETVPGAKAGI